MCVQPTPFPAPHTHTHTITRRLNFKLFVSIIIIVPLCWYRRNCMEYYITYISFRSLSYIIDAGMRAWPSVYRISVWQQEGRQAGRAMVVMVTGKQRLGLFCGFNCITLRGVRWFTAPCPLGDPQNRNIHVITSCVHGLCIQ